MAHQRRTYFDPAATANVQPQEAYTEDGKLSVEDAVTRAIRAAVEVAQRKMMEEERSKVDSKKRRVDQADPPLDHDQADQLFLEEFRKLQQQQHQLLEQWVMSRRANR